MSIFKPGKGSVGLEVRKEFNGEVFKGWVTKYFKGEDLYHVKYEDDDEEDIDVDELHTIMIQLAGQTEPAAEETQGASGSGPPPGKTRRTTRSSLAAADAAEGSPPKPKKSRDPRSSKRTVAPASEAQRPAKKKAPAQAAADAEAAAPVSEDGLVAEAAPAAEAEPVAEAEQAAGAEAAFENGVGPSEPEAASPLLARGPPPGEGAGRDAVEDLYKNVDILRTHPAKGGRPGPDRFNQVVYSRGFLYLAGQICEDTTAEGMDTYYGQTKQVLSQIKSLLNHSGSCMDRILQVNVHLKDIEAGADEFNQAWLEVMDKDHLPARTTVQAHLMRSGLLVEATAIAAVFK